MSNACRGRPMLLYAALMIAQSVGAAMIIFNGVPIYRRLIAGVGSTPAADPAALWMAGCAIVLIQSSHWVRKALSPTPALRRSAFGGHIMLFLSRISFIFATSLFSTVFFVRLEELDLSVWRMATLVGVLYSMFCFMTDLEDFGRALQHGQTAQSSTGSPPAPAA